MVLLIGQEEQMQHSGYDPYPCDEQMTTFDYDYINTILQLLLLLWTSAISDYISTPSESIIDSAHDCAKYLQITCFQPGTHSDNTDKSTLNYERYWNKTYEWNILPVLA